MITTINEAIDVLKDQFAGLADELTALKEQIAKDNQNYDTLIDALEKVNEEQQKEIERWRIISIVGLSIAGVSFVSTTVQAIMHFTKKGKM